MANKKRSLSYYSKNLGRFHLDRNDILVIEQILKDYAAVYDGKIMSHYADVSQKQAIKSKTRKFADVHIKVGKRKSKLPKFGWLSLEIDYSGVEYFISADSIKFLPKYIRATRYAEVTCNPGISLTISPFRCELGAQRQYATGTELRAMDDAFQQIETYFSTCKRASLSRLVVHKK